MPNQRETIALSEGDQSWLGSTRGIRTNRTATLVAGDFADFTRDGYIPSGTAVTETEDGCIPYVAGAILSGFIFTDQIVPVNDEEFVNFPLVDFGRVRTERLPFEFEAPTAENNATTIVFI